MSRPGKPAGLVTRAETKAKKAERAQKENALRPKRGLSLEPSARLKGHKAACFIWRRLMRRYSELEAVIVTGLDWILVENFCLAVQQYDELINMRRSAYQVWEKLDKASKEISDETPVEDQIKIWMKVGGSLSDATKLDARIDRKEALLHQLGQSLYITPRSRAGTAPKPKEKEMPPDDMEQLLDDVKTFVNEQ